MLWILSVLLLGALYSFFAVFIGDPFGLTWVLLLVLLIILFVCEIIILVRSTQAGNTEKKCRQMRRVMLFVKLTGIPLFVANFFLWTIALSMASVIPGAIIMWFTPGPWLSVLRIVLATYLAMLSTSFYSFSAIELYYKAGMLKRGERTLHIVLQLIFVADVVDAVYLFVVLRRREKGILKAQAGDSQSMPLQSAPTA